jgi:hypothetical protein
MALESSIYQFWSKADFLRPVHTRTGYADVSHTNESYPTTATAADERNKPGDFQISVRTGKRN